MPLHAPNLSTVTRRTGLLRHKARLYDIYDIYVVLNDSDRPHKKLPGDSVMRLGGTNLRRPVSNLGVVNEKLHGIFSSGYSDGDIDRTFNEVF
jgi:hypothetical protein